MTLDLFIIGNIVNVNKMKRKILLASALCVSALSAGAQSWLGDVNQMIDEGAFAKAQVVLDGLPQSEKDANKIRIDL